MPRVLIDTSAIYAFVARTDANHDHALAYVKHARERGSSFVLLALVFAETMTLLKARLGSDVAVRVGSELRRNSAYQWAALGADSEAETWAAFQHFADKAWSYTDCAVLVTSERLACSQVFSFDRHFSQMPGITRVP
jgi:uncharacterized protein